MDRRPSLEVLVAPLRSDVESGAAVLARLAADAFLTALEQAPARDQDELRAMLEDLAVRVLDAQPAMAPLVTLAARVLDAADGEGPIDVTRDGIARAVRTFRDEAETRVARAAEHAAELLVPGSVVVTTSHSSSVERALLSWSARTGGRVVCLESRPGNEGRRLARTLSEAGIAVTYAVDAAVTSLVATSDFALMGADSVGDRGVVNKVGSAALAEAARRRGVPVHVVIDETKLLPTGFPQRLAEARPPAEVWDAPRGVEVWNRYFEVVPLEHVTSIVTDSGVLSPQEVSRVRARIAVPERLRAWAERWPRGA